MRAGDGVAAGPHPRPAAGSGRPAGAGGPRPRGQLRRVGLALVLLALAGCAAGADGPGPAMPAVPRPEWRVGDRWVFQRTALGGATAVVTHEVVAATADGYTVRLRGMAGQVSRQWTAELALAAETGSDGVVARYEPPVRLFAWPLALGQEWSQEFAYADGRRDGRYTNTWRVAAGVEAIDVVAGRFYTVRVERWAGAQRLETYWYNARVRYWVRLEDYLRGYVEELVESAGWRS